MTVHWFEQCASEIPPDNDWLSTAEQAQLRGMRFPKRRADWRLGRWTAKQAVAAYLHLPLDPKTLATVELRPTEFGAPVVFLDDLPASVSVSLSHRSDVAACAVAASGMMLGCDLEVIEPRSEAFVADYFTPGEQALVAQVPAVDREKVVNLVWSAKESALKALGMGLRLNSHCVVISSVEGLVCTSQLGLNCIGNLSFPGLPETTLWHAMRADHTGGQVFQGWWQQTGLLLRTMVANPAPEQPVLLAVTDEQGALQ